MYKRILIVCTGNICRSPLAEVLFQSHMPWCQVSSAGIAVDNCHLSGSPAAPYSQQIARAIGCDLSKHSAKQLTPALVNAHQLILVMDTNQLEHIAHHYPNSRPKLLLLGQWSNISHIDDPIGQSLTKFEHTFNQITTAVLAWKQVFNHQHNPNQ